MIYNFSDHHQRFQYQNQSSPGNEHYVRSHRYSPNPLRGIIMNIPSVLLFYLVSFADVIVTASPLPIFFLFLCTPLAVSYWIKLDILCIPLCNWLSKHPSPWKPSFDASVIVDVSQDLLLTPAASKSRFHYLIEQATHIRPPVHSIKALCQDY